MPGLEPLRVVIAGGGTGGHLYPGIAVAREIQRRDPAAVVTFAGTAYGLEARVLPREGFELDLIRSGGLKGKSLATRIRNVGLLAAGSAGAWTVLTKRSPDVVIGLGGYSSGPVVLLAALRRIPTLLMEQNAVPGLTNRLLARVVSAAAVTYEGTAVFFGGKAFVAGNPVRPEFLAAGHTEIAEREQQPRGATGVLVFGGSQGAHAINVAMVEAAAELVAASIDLVLTHQTGERDVEMVREGYRKAGQAARVEPFLFAMAREMTAADLVVCRAGATTAAEITAVGRPSILIPLPTATDDHQRRNAEVLAQAGAAEVIEQRDLTGARLAGRILALARDPDRRRQMAAAARQLARPDAAAHIADRVLALAGRTGV
jgi:UDP-N-acetylglucosamine--N-acetylmuramyl-(pentapeptide) pyrophosphoryl-undecaprenol N-acetylglucosamine transferase